MAVAEAVWLSCLLGWAAGRGSAGRSDVGTGGSRGVGAEGGGRLVLEQDMIKSLLGAEDSTETYDWRIRPRGPVLPDVPLWKAQSPVFVTTNMYLRTISKVDDVNMEYSLHFTFREEWDDERLRFDHPKLKYINLSPGQKIWMPDTFFQNEKDGKKHDIDTPNVLIRVYGGDSGHILYSVRMTLTLSCPMDLHNYPMDTQRCFVDFASYAYTTQDISYVWKRRKPIQIKEGLHRSLPSFTLSEVRIDNCTSVTNTGAYSCLRTVLVLKREFSYYLLQLYIPSFMLVAVSWVSFWLDKDSVPARVTLGVTTLLTMTTQASGINANLPPVSYTKAIDVWIGVCLAFIFGALLEFALVNYAARKDMLAESRRRRNLHPLQRSLQCFQPHDPQGLGQPLTQDPFGQAFEENLQEERYLTQMYAKTSRLTRMWRVKYRSHAKRIDVASRFIFPIAFVVFNVVYWILYLRPYLSDVPGEDPDGP